MYIVNGLQLKNNTVSPNTKLDISGGACVSDGTGGVGNFSDPNGMTKDLSAAWVAGSGNGGLFSGSVAANTVYHVFTVSAGGGFLDYGFDTDASGANVPSGYFAGFRLGAVLTDANSHIRAFHQHGDEFWLDTSVLDYNVTNPGTSAVTRTLTVPTGVQVQAIFTSVSWDSTQNTQHYCSSIESTDEAPSYANAIEVASSNTSNEAVAQNRIWTNTSAQIRSRLTQSGANTAFKIRTRGWVDARGK